ncbi:MAG: hypothetical protein KJP21_06175 [Bacteroidia bacterium]|nr:hypothetical protein [Bacteroidia bacterium]NNJ55203.1 hypothetical protein [Bacteroidia bacterium]
MKKKTIITLILTLLLGSVIGFFISGRLAHNRMKHIGKVMDNPKLEQQFLEKRFKLSKEQMVKIEPILDSMLPIQNQIRKNHRLEMDSARNEMFNAISPYLTDSQRNRIAKMKNNKRRKRPPLHRRGH